MNRAICDKLKELRKHKLLFKADLAKRMNVDPETVEKWESGELTPSNVELAKLAEIYEVTEGYLSQEESSEKDNFSHEINQNSFLLDSKIKAYNVFYLLTVVFSLISIFIILILGYSTQNFILYGLISLSLILSAIITLFLGTWKSKALIKHNQNLVDVSEFQRKLFKKTHIFATLIYLALLLELPIFIFQGFPNFSAYMRGIAGGNHFNLVSAIEFFRVEYLYNGYYIIGIMVLIYFVAYYLAKSFLMIRNNLSPRFSVLKTVLLFVIAISFLLPKPIYTVFPEYYPHHETIQVSTDPSSTALLKIADYNAWNDFYFDYYLAGDYEFVSNNSEEPNYYVYPKDTSSDQIQIEESEFWLNVFEELVDVTETSSYITIEYVINEVLHFDVSSYTEIMLIEYASILIIFTTWNQIKKRRKQPIEN